MGFTPWPPGDFAPCTRTRVCAPGPPSYSSIFTAFLLLSIRTANVQLYILECISPRVARSPAGAKLHFTLMIRKQLLCIIITYFEY